MKQEKLESLLSTVIRWAGDAVEIADTEANLIFVNEAFERMTGYTLEEVRGKTPASLLRSERQDHEVYDVIWKAVTAGDTWSGQLTRRTKDGRHRLFEITVAPVIDQGETQYLIAISRDVTDRIREEQRRIELLERISHLQKMESLGMMAGRFAHDFNNLLTSITGNLSLAQDLTQQKEVNQCLTSAMVAMERASDLTQQMLLYSGGKKPRRRYLCLNDVVNEVKTLFKAPFEGIRIDPKLQQKLPAIHGDATQMGQVVLNLVKNAAEALGPAGGGIGIETSLVHFKQDEPSAVFHNRRLDRGSYVSLNVSDTGEGIHPALMDQIFDPFYTSKKDGSGLGLSSVLGIVKSHGGDIRVQSQPGVGSHFNILLPVAEGQVEEKTTSSSQPSGRKANGKVLLIDDESTVRQLMAAALSLVSLEPLHAADGLEGWRIYEQNHEDIDVILLDLVIPKMDGESLLARIKAHNPKQPVIICSGFVATRTQAEGQCQPDAVIEKPFTPHKLLGCVMDVIGKG